MADLSVYYIDGKHDVMVITIDNAEVIRLDIKGLCGDKTETVDETILKATMMAMEQLYKNCSRDDIDIDEFVKSIVIPYLSYAIRPLKRRSAGMRRLRSPYM